MQSRGAVLLVRGSGGCAEGVGDGGGCGNLVSRCVHAARQARVACLRQPGRPASTHRRAGLTCHGLPAPSALLANCSIMWTPAEAGKVKGWDAFITSLYRLRSLSTCQADRGCLPHMQAASSACWACFGSVCWLATGPLMLLLPVHGRIGSPWKTNLQRNTCHECSA